MINCQDASRLASESIDHTLPLGKRLSLKFHLLMCRFCRRYLRQIRFIREAFSLLDEEMKWTSSTSDIELSPDAKDRIKEVIREQ